MGSNLSDRIQPLYTGYGVSEWIMYHVKLDNGGSCFTDSPSLSGSIMTRIEQERMQLYGW